MNTAQTINPLPQNSPRLKARVAGLFYLLVILAGAVTLLLHGTLRTATDLFATACYLVVTAIFYTLFKPVSPTLSLLAASSNVVGLTIGKFHLVPRADEVEFAFFGLFCLLIGYLITRSTFLPHVLGVFMAIAGLGYMTFLIPPLANGLSPYNLAAGVLGETSLTLWLLLKGVNTDQWNRQAKADR
jgi:hypothetical protein